MKNWLTIPLHDIIIIKKGEKPQRLENEAFVGSMPYLDIAAIERNEITRYAPKQLLNVADEADIFVLRTGGRNGLILKGKKGIIGSTLFCLTPIVIKNSYLYYYLKFKEFEYSDTRDIRTTFWAMKIPIPSLSEQTQIVSILDSVFEYLAQAQKQLATIPRLLERYRQSVLEQAVSGELTEDWREEYGINMSWTKEKIGNIAEIQLGKMLDVFKNQGKSTKYLRNVNVRWFDVDLANLKEMKATEQEIEKYNIKFGDVLVCEGGEAGRAAIWKSSENSNLIFQKAIHRVRLNPLIMLSEWLVYSLRVDTYKKNIDAFFTGSTIKHFTLESLKKYIVNTPSVREQIEIVRRVEKLLKKADEIEAKYHAAMKFMAKLQQSILTMAFRGELSEPQANDEPVTVLLERIKKEKNKIEAERKLLQKQQSILKRNMAKQTTTTKSIVDLLSEAPNQTLTVEEVWKESVYYQKKEVELFYEELSKLEREGKITHKFKDANNVRTNLILSQNAH